MKSKFLDDIEFASVAVNEKVEDLINMSSALLEEVDRLRLVVGAFKVTKSDAEAAEKLYELSSAVIAFDNWQRHGYDPRDTMSREVSRVLWDRVREAAEIVDVPQDSAPCLFS